MSVLLWLCLGSAVVNFLFYFFCWDLSIVEYSQSDQWKIATFTCLSYIWCLWTEPIDLHSFLENWKWLQLCVWASLLLRSKTKEAKWVAITSRLWTLGADYRNCFIYFYILCFLMQHIIQPLKLPKYSSHMLCYTCFFKGIANSLSLGSMW